MRNKVLIAITAFMLLVSCNENYVYQGNKDISPKGWHKDSTVQFIAPITDTINNFDIYISIRNTNDYPKENLYLFVRTTSPHGNFVVDTINFTLADAYGKWKGKHISRIWDNKFLFRTNVRFANSGDYKFSIEQGMRYDILEGINNVSLHIKNTEENK